MGKKIVRLSGLNTLGVAVVTRGANNKRFAFAKGDDGVTTSQMFLELFAKGAMPFDEAQAEKICSDNGLDQQGTETFKALCKLAWAYRDNDGMKTAIKQGLMGMLGAGENDQGDPAEPDADDQGSGDMTEAEKKAADEAKKAADEAKKAADADAVAKAEAVAKADKRIAELEAVIKSQDAIVKNAEAIAKKLDEQMRRQAWVQKARDDLAYIPGKAEDHAEELLKLEALSSETASKHFESLKALSATMKASGLLQPAGHQGVERGVSNGGAWAEVEKQANEVIVKAAAEGKRLDVAAKARTIVALMKSNREIYKQWLRDHPAQAQRN